MVTTKTYRISALARHGGLRGGHGLPQHLASRAGALGALAPQACFAISVLRGGEPGIASIEGDKSFMQPISELYALKG